MSRYAGYSTSELYHTKATRCVEVYIGIKSGCITILEAIELNGVTHSDATSAPSAVASNTISRRIRSGCEIQEYLVFKKFRNLQTGIVYSRPETMI